MLRAVVDWRVDLPLPSRLVVMPTWYINIEVVVTFMWVCC
jgi:hypothetical protein